MKPYEKWAAALIAVSLLGLAGFAYVTTFWG